MQESDINEAYEKFKPESSVFVISVDKEGKPNGMAVGWQMKCSMEPPMLAVSISNKYNTHRLIRESEDFVVAVANKELEKELLFFGTNHGNKVDKFKETGLETIKAKYVKSPLIKNATINFECKLEKETEAGDHIIFIGRILTAHINKDKKVLFNTKKVAGERYFEEY